MQIQNLKLDCVARSSDKFPSNNGADRALITDRFFLLWKIQNNAIVFVFIYFIFKFHAIYFGIEANVFRLNKCLINTERVIGSVLTILF